MNILSTLGALFPGYTPHRFRSGFTSSANIEFPCDFYLVAS